MGLEVLISLGFYEFVEPSMVKSLSSENLVHYFGMIRLISTILVFTIIFTVFFRNVFHLEQAFVKAKKIKFEILLYLLILTIGLELFDRAILDLDLIYNFLSSGLVIPYESSESSSIAIIYTGISGLIIAPIFEELFFRKFLFVELTKKYSLVTSIIVSSVLFSAVHLPIYSNLVPTFIFGITACLIYHKTRNIFYCIILHFLGNLTWLLLEAYGGTYYEWLYGLNFDIYYWLLFIIGFALIYFAIKKITVANII